MKKNLKASTSLSFNAKSAKVWDAITNPEQIKKYLMGAEVSSDWKVGSPITYKGEFQGKAFNDKGTIKKFEPGKVLQSTYWSSMGGKVDKPENYATVTQKISQRNGKTVLTITQDNIENEKGVIQAKQNWKSVLKTMKEILEKK